MKRTYILILIIVIFSTIFYGCSCNSADGAKDNIKSSETIIENKENNVLESSIGNSNNNKTNTKTKSSKENSIVNQNDNQKDSSKEKKDSNSQNEEDVIFGTNADELPIMRAD